MGIRVLLADDAEIVREALSELILARQGLELVGAVGDGAAAIELAARTQPDVAIVDVNMPGGGAAGIRDLLAVSPATRVIAFSGETDPAAKAQMSEAGAADFLVKGSPISALYAVIESAGARVAPPRPIDKPKTTGRELDYKTLFESVPGLYFVLDPDFTILAASDAMLQASNTRREEIVGRYHFDVFPENPEDTDAHGERNLRASLERVRRTLRPDTMAVQKYDIQKPVAEGGGFETRYWSPHNVPVVGPNRQLRYFIHRVEDVTEFVLLKQSDSEHLHESEDLRERTRHMEAEVLQRAAELQELNTQLEAANDAKSRFLSRMSHEFRTPLTAILGFGELLKLAPLSLEQHGWAVQILRAGDHLLDLIGEVLDISRVEAGELTVSVEPVSVAGLVGETTALVQPLARARQISLTINTEIAGSYYIMADHQRCKQILLNLLSNAIKYNRREGNVIVEVSEPRREWLRLSVTDTGAGLTSEQVQKLFTPFQRLNASQTDVEGTGLGLALSRRLAEAMGGVMGVASEPGRGSTFWVEFPTAHPVAITDTPSEGEALEVRRYHGPKKVLYVEDTVANFALVEEVLRLRPDVKLIPAMLGGVALELAREHRPDLILLDVHLPDLPGDEVMGRLRGDRVTSATRIVILSADATRWQRDRMLAAGADGYMTKPIRIAALLEMLDESLGPPVG